MAEKITIVMTIRENYSLTLTTIDSLIKHTTLQYKLIFIDYKLPEFIKKKINPDIEIIETDSIFPSVSLYNVIPNIDSKYVVFLDNNILFTPYWLEKLVECMETNNAGIVGPLYLWNNDKIHMFGGDIKIINNTFSERHYLSNKDSSIINTLKEKKCDFVEYHCLMIRNDLLKQNVLDPSLLTIHQHIDLSLEVKKLGYDTYITPYSIIIYNNNFKIEDYEIEFFTNRWSIELVEKDIDYFCKKWNFINNNSFDNVRGFAKQHIKKIKN
jgi:GT2 family glycosyltransferase